ncbi:pyrimidine 5'-nucleotidase [Sphingosinithalassobacter portus]|uniref:pyrimidine 5'-nucleotidase n=1 Tax=Stakelama portus TaxID=2676234 RepID=UPI000D6E4754|nr:pyrimidine 5'-nucleotidase [Sphingosinithalassobacter portus]
MPASLSHVRNWIFDLDNTLYPASTGLFALVDRRIGDYVARLLDLDPVEARRVQKHYFHHHGTTLNGLMADHGVDPHEFYADVHDIELDALARDESLVGAIARLPGRKLIFTNADAPYAERVLDRLGLTGAFEAIHDVHASAYRPKPDPVAYRGLCDAYDLDPAQSLFAEDLARNLKPAKDIGMTTLWVDNGSEQPPNCTDRSYVDHIVSDLAAWLHAIMEEQA